MKNPDQPSSLLLTAEERNLLSECCDVAKVEVDYLKRINEAPTDQAEFLLYYDELNDLVAHLRYEDQFDQSFERHRLLVAICEKAVRLLEAYADEGE